MVNAPAHDKCAAGRGRDHDGACSGKGASVDHAWDLKALIRMKVGDQIDNALRKRDANGDSNHNFNHEFAEQDARDLGAGKAKHS